jgi:hypothetical protein
MPHRRLLIPLITELKSHPQRVAVKQQGGEGRAGETKFFATGGLTSVICLTKRVKGAVRKGNGHRSRLPSSSVTVEPHAVRTWQGKRLPRWQSEAEYFGIPLLFLAG